MATSLDALEALLQFREGHRPAKRPRARAVRLAVPVPNPLDLTQPHLIEGDAPVRATDATAERSALAPRPQPAIAPVVAQATMVPDPLSASARWAKKRPASLPARPATISSSPNAGQNQKVAHGFGMGACESPAASRGPLEVEVRTDKINDALQSKPQRGKKREDLSDLERLELTRTRNREHARCTRTKKKARLDCLVHTEKKYALLQAEEARNDLRRKTLEDLVETSAENGNSPSSTLQRLASRVVLRPKFSLAGRVALSEDSGMVKVSVRGQDLDSGEVRTLSGVVCAEFGPGTAGISSASVYWSSPERTAQDAQRAGIPPSVSVLSFSS